MLPTWVGQNPENGKDRPKPREQLLCTIAIKRAFLKSLMCRKPVGVSSFFNQWPCLSWFLFLGMGRSLQSPWVGHRAPTAHIALLCSLCQELVAPRLWAIKPQLWFQSRELSAPPPANCIVFTLASCLGQFPFFRQPLPLWKAGCFNLPPLHPLVGRCCLWQIGDPLDWRPWPSSDLGRPTLLN